MDIIFQGDIGDWDKLKETKEQLEAIKLLEQWLQSFIHTGELIKAEDSSNLLGEEQEDFDE